MIDCPPPWESFEDECYKFDLNPVFAQVAVETCEVGVGHGM